MSFTWVQKLNVGDEVVWRRSERCMTWKILTVQTVRSHSITLSNGEGFKKDKKTVDSMRNTLRPTSYFSPQMLDNFRGYAKKAQEVKSIMGDFLDNATVHEVDEIERVLNEIKSRRIGQ